MNKVSEVDSLISQTESNLNLKPANKKSSSNSALLFDTKKKEMIPRHKRINQISRKLNEDYVKQIKQTEIKARKREDLYQELDLYSKKVSEIKINSRDEEILKMQKENQEIETQLLELKNNKDNAELASKQEESRKLIEELNNLFNEKKKEAAEKDDERNKVLEEIKQIKKYQEEHREAIKKLEEEKKQKAQIIKELEEDVKKLQIYEKFFNPSGESSSDVNIMVEKLKAKFENLIERMNEIEKDIDDKDNDIKNIKREQLELKSKNDKQAQNKRLVELEDLIRSYTDENKKLETEIDTLIKTNQKKDVDTHQIKLTINNLYNKLKLTNDYDLNVDDDKLCENLGDINEKIMELIEIYNRMENNA